MIKAWEIATFLSRTSAHPARRVNCERHFASVCHDRVASFPSSSPILRSFPSGHYFVPTAGERTKQAAKLTNYRIRQVFNYLVGSLVRIFTTLQEVDDKLILFGFVAGFMLNCVLAAQMLYYWNQPSAKALGKRKEKVASAKPLASSSSSSSARGATATGAAAVPKKAPTTRRRG